MKNIFLFIILSFCQNNYCQSTNFKLIAENKTDSGYKLHYVLKVKNLSDKNQNFILAREVCFMGDMFLPSVEFVAETFVDGKWRKFKDPKIKNIDCRLDLIESDFIIIKPNEEVVIGEIYRHFELKDWFNFLDDAKIRLYFIYKIKTPNKKDDEYQLFTKNNIKELIIESNKIEYNYINKLNKKEYLQNKQWFINYSFRVYFEKNFNKLDVFKNKILLKTKTQFNDDVLNEITNGKKFNLKGVSTPYIENFSKHRIIRLLIFEVDNKLRCGIFFSNDNSEKKYFTEFNYDPKVVTDFLYKD